MNISDYSNVHSMQKKIIVGALAFELTRLGCNQTGENK